MKESSSAFQMLTGKLTEKGLLGKSRYKWEDNIRISLKEMDVNKKNWIDLA